MRLTERDRELGELQALADRARSGRGEMVLVCGESGAGKTSVVEAFVQSWVRDERVLWGACDPLPTPRPLGPVHDVAHLLAPATRSVLDRGDQPYDIFAAVYDDLRTAPSVLVLDDLHWADQGTVDLLRFVLRRVAQTRSLVVGMVRDDELAVGHPMRALLGDVARSARASTVSLPALSERGVRDLIGERPVDPEWLHGITGGNAFFVCEMLEHHGSGGGRRVGEHTARRVGEHTARGVGEHEVAICRPPFATPSWLARPAWTPRRGTCSISLPARLVRYPITCSPTSV